MKVGMDDPGRIWVHEEIYRQATAFDELVAGKGFVFAEVIEQCFRDIDDDENELRWKDIGAYLKLRKQAGDGAVVTLN